ncbi:MAG: substrate-binding domain-containing protein [Oscillospiraceae bacterium]|nr:substrate-binding domain-containing protein [Oscillospiraceae bacterium]
MKRKRIGLLTTFPEGIYAQRIMEGVFAQCRAYDYDVFVFTPLVQVVHYFRDYLNGELNIFKLINFDMLDGVIVDTSTLTEDHIPWVAAKLLEQLKKSCKKPVISVDLAFGDYPIVNTDDAATMAAITAHVLDHHGCKNIYYLSGYYGHEVAEERLRGFTQELEKRNIPVEQDKIFYGDFWYTGGETLADRIVSGEIKLPEAIICASDHLAIGLANRLMKHGIRIPDDVIVTGHDATAEAMLNHLTVTTHVPETGRSAAEAVNRIRALIEPDAELLPAAQSAVNGLICGDSCGCGTDKEYLHEILSSALVHNYQNLTNADTQDQVDLGRLNMSYMFESITEKPSVHEALYGIMYNSYLLRPYRNFWLCLREDWLDTDHPFTDGYPEVMRNVLHAVPQNTVVLGQTQHCGDSPMYNFETKLLIPDFPENREKPSVFYFSPVHFQDNMLGYAVLECDLAQKHKIGSVYHLWIRNVSNALEMKRLHERGERAAQSSAEQAE